MLMLPVDLFSAYTKGREYGIDRNWNDLNKSATLQSQWLTNDHKTLQNTLAGATLQNQVDMSNLGVGTAEMNYELLRQQYPALYNKALTDAERAQIQRQIFVDNPEAVTAAENAAFGGSVAGMNAAGQQAQAKAAADISLLPAWTNAYNATNMGNFGAAMVTGAAAPALAKGSVANQLGEQQLVGAKTTAAGGLVKGQTDLAHADIDTQIAELNRRKAAITAAASTPVGSPGVQPDMAKQASIAQAQQIMQTYPANSIPYLQAQQVLQTLLGTP